MRNEVKEQRRQRSMSQAELATELGVSRQTIIAIESGKYSPSLTLAFRIARYFDESVEELFNPDEEEVDA